MPAKAKKLDYRVGFSAVLPLLSDKEIQWCREELKNRSKSAKGTASTFEENNEEESKGCDFKATIEKYGVWFRATKDGFGTPEHVANFVLKFLKKFKKNFIWSMQWADWSDTDSPEVFGGGVVVVSAKAGQRWLTTNEWASKTTELLRRSKKKLTYKEMAKRLAEELTDEEFMRLAEMIDVDSPAGPLYCAVTDIAAKKHPEQFVSGLHPYVK